MKMRFIYESPNLKSGMTTQRTSDTVTGAQKNSDDKNRIRSGMRSDEGKCHLCRVHVLAESKKQNRS